VKDYVIKFIAIFRRLIKNHKKNFLGITEKMQFDKAGQN